MKKMNKARKVSDPLIKDILDSTPLVQKEKILAKMELAARIEDAMLAKSVNKSSLASKVGKQPSEVTKWLSGTHNFTIETLVEIAHALEVKVAQLFDQQDVSRQQSIHFTIHVVAKPASFSKGTPPWKIAVCGNKNHRKPIVSSPTLIYA